ncbi:MAG: radical SAM protein [Deltaproteobacteria bacterium]|nr:radical SAM protein [Deltaproteobacteria bacterium]
MSNNEGHFIIPVFIPHQGCPHKCIFCNQSAITGVRQPFPMSPNDLLKHVQKYLEYKKEKRKTTEIAFFGGNFLGLKRDRIDSMLKEANLFVKSGQVDGIRFSTRPDTIDTARLDFINAFPVTTVELGVQSMDDRILSKSKRGHTSADTDKAFFLLKNCGLKTGLQMMVGLPGDDGSHSIDTAEKLARLCPDYIRIYPTIVLSGSPLAEWYKSGAYTPLPLEESINLVKEIYCIFRKKNIRVIRMGLQASKDLDNGAEVLAGPYHPAFGHLVLSSLFLDMAKAELKNRKDIHEHAVIKVHPRNISRMQGLNKSNIPILKKEFNLNALEIIGDSNLTEENLCIHPKPTGFLKPILKKPTKKRHN